MELALLAIEIILSCLNEVYYEQFPFGTGSGGASNSLRHITYFFFQVYNKVQQWIKWTFKIQLMTQKSKNDSMKSSWVIARKKTHPFIQLTQRTNEKLKVESFVWKFSKNKSNAHKFNATYKNVWNNGTKDLQRRDKYTARRNIFTFLVLYC